MMDIFVEKTLRAPGGEMTLRVKEHLPAHQLIGLFGKSGAGKTSLLRTLAGLLQPDAGKIVVDGATWLDTAAGINRPPQKRQVGLVFQDYALFPNMTVRENLAFALAKGQDPRIVADLVALSELGDLQHQRPIQLSGGQQQRVALARALVHRPRLLLLDEPLSALDLEMRQKLQQYLLRVHREYQLTTMLISHDPAELCSPGRYRLGARPRRNNRPGITIGIFRDATTRRALAAEGENRVPRPTTGWRPRRYATG